MTLQELWSLLNFYKSVFSGEQIDAAIGVILNGGIDAAVDAAEASAAAAAQSAKEAAGSATDLGAAVKNAQSAAGLADSSAKTAESYAKGGTGTREGEDTDNAKFYCEQAQRIAGGEFIVSVNGEGADETGNFTLTAAKIGAIDAAEKGAAGGVAELDVAGKVPAAQMPPLEDYGAVSRKGDTMNGVLTVKAQGDTPVIVENTGSEGGSFIQFKDTTGRRGDIGIASNGEPLFKKPNADWYRFYHTGNKPTPADIGAAPAIESADYPGCYYRIVGGVTEWINPPMILGVEYRTTERHLGKVVYAKLVDVGELPNNGRKDVGIGPSEEYYFNSELYVRKLDSGSYGYAYLPIANADGVQAKASVYANNIMIFTYSDQTGWFGVAACKYTKD